MKNPESLYSFSPTRSCAAAETITFAASARWDADPNRLSWLHDQGLSVEYTPDAQQLERIKPCLSQHLEKGVAVRHHAYFPGYEIGDARASNAREAMELHLHYLDLIQGIGEPHVTVHIGLNPDQAVDHETAVANLTRLVSHGRARGITVSLENLRFGPTSNPSRLVNWAARGGAGITLDIGHACSSQAVMAEGVSITEIVDMVGYGLNEIHLYEKETDVHHAPVDMSIIGPAIDRVMQTDCTWWTIELDSYQEILHTRSIVKEHLCRTQPA